MVESIAGCGVDGEEVKIDPLSRLGAVNDAILFGFGKDEHGYFVFDWDGGPLVEACSSIDEILAVFK